ncbi:MAG: THUMP domain-containing protein [Candidatus Helarchaeota archaeon]
MKKDFNLLISCPRFHERDALAEIWYLYSNIGDDELEGNYTSFPGLITARTYLRPIQSIRDLRLLIVDDPLLLRFVLKIIPIETIVETSLEEIMKIAKIRATEIQQTETFRITVKSRFSALNTQELITEVAELIDREVDLTNPDKIMMIQILGTITGISLLESEDILRKVEFQEFVA